MTNPSVRLKPWGEIEPIETAGRAASVWIMLMKSSEIREVEGEVCRDRREREEVAVRSGQVQGIRRGVAVRILRRTTWVIDRVDNINDTC